MTNQAIDYQPHTTSGFARIIGAIAAKDLSQMVKNRTLLSALLSTLFILVLYRFLPIISNPAEPAVFLYDPAGESALTLALDNSDEVRTYVHKSPEDVIARMQHGEVPELGIVLPDDIQTLLDDGGPVQLTGLINYWVSDGEATNLADQVAGILSVELGRPVTITIDENRVDATLLSSGLAFLMGVSMVIAILMIGLGVVPLLVLEEKQTHTLDALLISPATPTHITLGKALAGLVLAAITAAITLLIYRPILVNWSLALPAILGWSLWAIAAGLLVGSLISTRQQQQITMIILFLPLILPAFLLVMTELLPVWLPPYLRLAPSAASMDLLRMTGMAAVPLNEIVWRLAIVYGTALILIAAVAWVIRRQRV